MTMLAEIFVVLVLIFTVLQYLLKIKPEKNFPPGPSGLPILGYVPFIRFPLHEHFGKLSKIYGKIMGVTLGNYRAVIVSDCKLLRKLFNDDRVIGRPVYKALEDALYGGKFRGLSMAHGKAYQEQRKFAVKNLKESGFGKSSVEQHVLDEVKELISEFRFRLNKPTNVTRGIQLAVLNVLWRAVSAERYLHDDPKMTGLIETVSKAHEAPYLIPLILPKLAEHFPRLTGFQIVIDTFNIMYEFFQKSIDAHKDNLDPNSPRDLIDIYLTQIKNTKDCESSFYPGEGEKELLVVLSDFFTAGMDPPALALNYTILYLATNPHVQEKLYAEILNVIGTKTTRLPSLSDRPSMPYAQAVILESLRMAAIAPFGIPHLAMETFEFEGYTIPKDTIIAGNLWQMQHDVEYWGDPETYRPERFITDDGQFRNDEGFCPFSTGKRVCPGEPLARNQIFLFVTGIVQHLQFSTDSKNPQILESHENGITRAPKPFDVIITERD